MGRRYDLGKDGIWSLVLSLALPTALAQAVNVLYAIVDRMYIGHIAGYGDIALAGVGVAAPIAAFISSFASLIGMGGAPIMAMREGHGDHEAAEGNGTTGFYLLLISAAILTPVFFLARDPVLMAFGASASTLPYASEYLGWYLLGTPFALLATGLNSFVINQGQSTKGMISVLAGAVMNIILDPIFIFLFGMGVKGAAIATVISQICSMLKFSSSNVIICVTLPARRLHLAPHDLIFVSGLVVGTFPVSAAHKPVIFVLIQAYVAEPALAVLVIDIIGTVITACIPFHKF